MIDKLEAGKTYRLIDKVGYFGNYSENATYFSKYFVDGCVTISKLCKSGSGAGSAGEDNDNIITNLEFKYFELVEDNDMSHLQTINSPFGELDKQTKKDLLCAWVDGAEIELWIDILECWSYPSGIKPTWKDNTIYRVKPTISAKDAAKAKLISEAQQQLRDAQEALDKAQQL